MYVAEVGNVYFNSVVIAISRPTMGSWTINKTISAICLQHDKRAKLKYSLIA